MKNILCKTGIVLVAIGLLTMFANFVSPCEPDSMIQTIETKLCETYGVFLMFAANTFSYVMVLTGAVLFLYGWTRLGNKARSEQ